MAKNNQQKGGEPTTSSGSEQPHQGEESWDIEPDDSLSQVGAPGSPRTPGGGNATFVAHYQNWDEAQRARVERINMQIDAANEDGLFTDAPVNAQAQKNYVGQLYTAIKSVDTVGPEAIIDKTGKNGAPSQAAQRISDGKYPDLYIEEACWEIYKKASIAQVGVKFVDSHHGDKYINPQQYASFDERWDEIVSSCRRSKALCKMLLDPPYLDRFITNPGGELKMKMNNKKINAQRDEQNEIGREFVRHGLKKKDATKVISGLAGPYSDEDDAYSAQPSRENVFDNNAITPARRRGRPARKSNTMSAKRKKSWGNEFSDDDEDGSYVDSAVRSSIKPSRRSGRLANTPNSSKRETLTSTGPRRLAAAPPRADQSHYKSVILNLLGLDHSMLGSYSLDDLRTYARVYNEDYQNGTFSLPKYPSSFINLNSLQPFSATDGGKEYAHFALLERHFLPLAIARGDLTEALDVTKTGNKLFVARRDIERMALGIVRNDFSLNTLYPPPAILASQQPTIPSQSPFGQSDGYRPPYSSPSAYPPATLESDMKYTLDQPSYTSHHASTFGGFGRSSTIPFPPSFDRPSFGGHYNGSYQGGSAAHGGQYGNTYHSGPYGSSSNSGPGPYGSGSNSGPYGSGSNYNQPSQYPDPTNYSADRYQH